MVCSKEFSLNLEFSQQKDSFLSGIALDEENGMIYATDISNHIIWKMTTKGNDLKTLTGKKGKQRFSLSSHASLKSLFGKKHTGIKGHEDGSAEHAKFNEPRHLGWINKRTLICAEVVNHTIRSVSIGNVITSLILFHPYQT
jgi:hypothetical protein